MLSTLEPSQYHVVLDPARALLYPVGAHRPGEPFSDPLKEDATMRKYLGKDSDE